MPSLLLRSRSGTKTLGKLIKNKISSFLKTELGLTLSQSKTRITNLLREYAKFLGFTITLKKPLRRSFARRSFGLRLRRRRRPRRSFGLRLPSEAKTSFGGREGASVFALGFLRRPSLLSEGASREGRSRSGRVVEIDIESCFPSISHEWMLDNIPLNRTLLYGWLKQGYIERK